MCNELERLDKKMLVAHSADNQIALIELYQKAANICEADGDIEATCFYLTHAYVLALEQGEATATDLRSRLRDFGREE